MLTIRGSDLKWTDALIACAAASNCASPGFVRQGDPKPLRDMITDRINGSEETDTARVIQEIRSKAANAVILLAGYPQVFTTGSQHQVPNYQPLPDIGGVGFSADEAAFLTEMAGKLVITIGSTFDLAVKTNYVDVRGDWADHELGGPLLSESYFNSLWVSGE
ncbi:hypothetical protein [Micromonospora sp. NBC_01638]|uniref:hypothetical protein n=1 Tax=Micromonospora sp. NBC_01638 TaxID=2975982 RepID=UPI003863BF69|nr:hypothetical protein OG811_24035 [Micromonospora sp. NBC_01638]